MDTRFFYNETKKYLLLFPLCVLIGAVAINMLGLDKAAQWNLFDADYINSVIMSELEFKEIFFFLLKKRLLHMVIIILVCFSTIRDRLMYGIVMWLGLTIGVVLAVLFLQYGFKGIWLFILAIMIHMFIYFVATVMLLCSGQKNDRNLLSGGYMLCLILFLTGIMAESLLNWGVIPKIMGFYY